jgi:site-specific DNA-methyltransferase (adenine-specific)/adenine-specific DNA-methyltransferase
MAEKHHSKQRSKSEDGRAGPELIWPQKEAVRLDGNGQRLVVEGVCDGRTDAAAPPADGAVGDGAKQRRSSDTKMRPLSCADTQRPLAGRLMVGDNRAVLAALEASDQPPLDLVYIDPPYGTGRARKMRSNQSTKSGFRVGGGFADRAADDPAYLSLMYEVFIRVRRLLSTRGQLFVHVDFRASAPLRLLLDEVMGGSALRNEIVWHYASGSRPTRFYARKSDTLLWYALGEDYTFEPQRIGRPRNRCWKCGSKLEKWNHLKACRDPAGRVYRTIRSGKKIYRYYDDEPIPPPNVWLDIAHIQQKDPQRTGYPTQKPVALLERIIAAHSNPGDWVADFFCGSGTTAVVAGKMGRRWIVCDSNPAAVEIAQTRLNRTLSAELQAQGAVFTRERLHGAQRAPKAKSANLALATRGQYGTDDAESKNR